MRAWRWEALSGAPPGKALPPEFSCDARPVQSFRGMSYCYALAYDEKNEPLLFAGMEGIVEYLDLRRGRIGKLLRPPEWLAVRKLVLSPNNNCLGVQAHELKMNSSRPNELRLWNYPALCAKAGL